MREDSKHFGEDAYGEDARLVQMNVTRRNSKIE